MLTSEYEVTFKMEILCEFAASVYGDYYRLKNAGKISTLTPALAAASKAINLKYEILDCETLEELQVIEDRLRDMKTAIEEVDHGSL